MQVQPKLMAIWRDVLGREVAHVFQGAKVVDGRWVPVFYAEVPGDRVERKRFKCAVDAVNEWARHNGVRAKMAIAG